MLDLTLELWKYCFALIAGTTIIIPNQMMKSDGYCPEIGLSSETDGDEDDMESLTGYEQANDD